MATIIIKSEQRKADERQVMKAYGINPKDPAMREAAEVAAARSREVLNRQGKERRYYKMIIKHQPETGKNFVSYEIDGNVISFNDEELTIKLSKKERDELVRLYIVEDETGGLVTSTRGGRWYVAEIVIPARRYIETAGNEEGQTNAEPVPFDIDRCELILWEMEAS